MPEWLERWTSNSEARSSNRAIAEFVLCSPEFKSTATLVK